MEPTGQLVSWSWSWGAEEGGHLLSRASVRSPASGRAVHAQSGWAAPSSASAWPPWPVDVLLALRGQRPHSAQPSLYTAAMKCGRPGPHRPSSWIP